MYGLAEAGKTDEQGRPNLLHMAVIGRKHLDDFALAGRRTTCKVLFALLAPIGRLFGYRVGGLEGLTKQWRCRRAALLAPRTASSVAPVSTSIENAPCAVASERPSHPSDEHRSDKPS